MRRRSAPLRKYFGNFCLVRALGRHTARRNRLSHRRSPWDLVKARCFGWLAFRCRSLFCSLCSGA